jgi:PAS domain S-box-containing protein
MPSASNPRVSSGRVPRLMPETGQSNFRIFLISRRSSQRDHFASLLDAPETSIFHLFWAEDIKTAVESLICSSAHIIVLDLEASKDLASMRSLLRNFPDIPLIALTAITQPFWHQLLLREGAQDFLCQDQIDAPLLTRSLSYSVERHIALQDLRASEGRFRSMVERNADGIVIVDCHQKVRFMNPAAEELLGWDQAELLGQIFEVPLATNLSQSQTEITLPHKDGQTIHSEFRFVAIEWEGEKAYMLSLRDISERREMEEAHARLVAILEDSTDFVAIADLKGRFLWINRAGRKLIKLESGDPAETYSLKDVVPSSTYQLLETVGLPTARAHGIWQDEAAVLVSSGEVIPVSMQIQAHKSNEGQVKYYSTVSRDISERKIAKEELESHSRILKSILNSMGDGVVVADEMGTYLHWNPEATRLLGAGAKDTLPSQWASDYGLLLPDSKKPFPFMDMPLYQAIQGQASDQVEMLVKRQTGEEIIISVTGRPLKRQDGTRKGGVVVIRDITDSKRASEQLQHYSAALEHKNQELQDFAYVASHDLKAPLRAISQISQWLIEDLGDDLPKESQRLISLMTSRVQRMQGLLDDLLRYARAGHDEAPTETIDTAAMIREIGNLMDMSSAFELIIDDSLPTFKTARAPLEQVFRNLIGNAIKHHDRDKGTIEIMAREAGDFFEFSVRDDGPGVAVEFHERVFKMFQTLKPRDKVDGSGMGLALVQKLIRTYGGNIQLNSSGRGTCITFTWPSL